MCKLNLEKQVEFTGYLSDQELVEAVSSSLALVQPSLSEGFGLTGVEAMSCGTPVLASDIPIFREIYKQAPLYFDPHQADSLISAVNHIKQPEVRNSRIRQGLEVVGRYSWKRMAEKTAYYYREAVNSN